MSSVCKHGVDCFERACEDCANEIFGKMGRLSKKDLPHAENMQGTRRTKPKPSIDDYDK